MKTIYIHKLFLYLIIILGAYSGADALEPEITPRKVAPGDVFLLQVPGTESATVEAMFLKQPVKMASSENGRLIALVPVDVNTKPRDYKLTITQGKIKQTANITVIPYKFKTIHLTLPESKVTLNPKDQKRATEEAILLSRLWLKYNARSWDGEFSAGHRDHRCATSQ